MKRKSEIGIYLILVIGIILSISVYYIVNGYERTKIKNYFEFNAQTHFLSLKRDVNKNINLVNSMAAMFSSSVYVTRKEFQNFVDIVLEQNPNIQGFSWNPYIKNTEQNIYIEKAQQDGFNDFEITGFNFNGKIIKNPNKKYYIPIYYIEPYLKNKKAMGFDISSHFGRNEAANKARDTGKLVITERIKLIQKDDNSFGYLLLKAIYKKGKTIDTLSKRRENFLGLVVGIYSLKNWANLVIKHSKPIDIDIFISDLSAPIENQLLYFHSSKTRKVALKPETLNLHAFENGMHWKKTKNILGREWSFLFTPAPMFFENNKTWNPMAYLITGLIITLLLMLYIFTKARDTAKLKDNYIRLMNQEEELEKEVKKRTMELEIASRAKSDFLANMSHEIRTPLNGVMGFIDILYKNEVDVDKRNKLQIIKESGNSLLIIINDILDFSKIENNKLVLEKNTLHISNLFTHTVELFFCVAKEKDISIILNIDEKLPEKTIGDSTRIKQVFSNILSNAIKFANTNSKIIVNMNYLKEDKQLFCEVIDEGIGIEAKKLNCVFKSFQQADSSTTRKYGGTGLGLSISKVLIELMNGEIGVESEINIGSRFYFILPLLVSDLKEEETEEREIEKGKVEDIQRKNLRDKILIVEDNKTNQLLLTMLLDEFGYKSFAVSNGLEATKEFKNNLYNLILMDENMPIMNGTEATKIIRTLDNGKDVPIIAVTANALKGDEEKFIQSGMDAYLSKPIDAEKLKAYLRKYLQ
ncbi:MAG: CHASE domain-containing protein [Sulfurimonas sp.]|nr:CHASE domain-containing protein [Sulfurimonas sp.]